ncbi:uncharacterized protein Z519_07984 [Cladophialophora bantiana CBS 173.52]|uniref:Vesicle-mediated transport protein Vid24 n=1 Tax=Cladophialophora bantiana (strain ATCC 10958 / CBS 173.52 / CDC B-1940 / NIH 8579) TaxID=1442370 RepID=A0A0D2HK32_CLAB1|nr:uncharacterized protein Z519_07984 [Cladophialophora bantiana CBS 173.52]KIW91090.1 hypothetical protein Z519_07984 [Cladophialophora bantiana CBS 173.52]
MPTHAPDTSFGLPDSEIAQLNVACPAPLTPPPEIDADEDSRRLVAQQALAGGDEVDRRPVSDNTAAGMARMQEETMYTTPPGFEEKLHSEGAGETPMIDSVDDDIGLSERIENDGERQTGRFDAVATTHVIGQGNARQHISDMRITANETGSENGAGDPGISPSSLTSCTNNRTRGFPGVGDNAGIPSIDQELDWSHNDLKEWDFSQRRLRPQYPSATFQPYSKFKGTQQSDRQIYNVEVTILTVDIEQCSMSGYLQICGLTPDHPTLTTFFTGEIIGGPNQKYSFRTRDPAWGASDKTDLTHWARFPAWRPLSLHAKRNINFVYPMNHENWWQQDYIFMRWKEHFLVPDYKLKSIQGASFEGFYYICFNQIEGRLELKHEGQPGIWRMGVCPAIEFR